MTDLLTAQQVAERLGMSAAWVRENKERFGVIRLGDGPRPRLRFDWDRVVAALVIERAETTAHRLRLRRTRVERAALLPIRGR